MNLIQRVKSIVMPTKQEVAAVLNGELKAHGHVKLEHFRGGKLIFEEEGPNIFTTEGMASILNTYLLNGSTPAAIYCGLFKGNVTPVVGDTAATKLGSGGGYTECQDADYDSPATNRATYTIATTTSASCTNSASKAEFVMNASITVYGAFLATAAAKTATTGVLICAKRFTSSRAVIADDELAITYAISLTTS